MAEAGHLVTTARNINSISSAFNKAAPKSSTQTFKIKASSKRNDISLVKHNLLLAIFQISADIPSSIHTILFHLKIFFFFFHFSFLNEEKKQQNNKASNYNINSWKQMAREMDRWLHAFPARPQLRRLGRRWKQKCTCLHQPLYWEGNFNTFLSPKLYFMYNNINERTLNLTPTTSNDGFDPSPIESQCGLLLERPRWVKIYSPTCFFFFFHFLWRSLLKNPFLSSRE